MLTTEGKEKLFRRDFLKTGLVGAAGLGLSLAARPATVADEVLLIGDSVQLFVDLDRVASTENVRQVFHLAQKHPANPVLRKVKPWENDRGTWGSVIYDERDKVFKAWYGGQS